MSPETPAKKKPVMRRRQNHKVSTASDGSWTCKCKKTGTDIPEVTSERHLHQAAVAAFRRLDDLSAATLIAFTPSGNPVWLLAGAGGWLNSGKLRRFARPYYDDRGCLSAMLDWPELLKAIDAGELTDHITEWKMQDGLCTVFVLRVAASLAGYGTVCLADLTRHLTRAEREAVLKILTPYMSDGEQ